MGREQRLNEQRRLREQTARERALIEKQPKAQRLEDLFPGEVVNLPEMQSALKLLPYIIAQEIFSLKKRTNMFDCLLVLFATNVACLVSEKHFGPAETSDLTIRCQNLRQEHIERMCTARKSAIFLDHLADKSDLEIVQEVDALARGLMEQYEK